MFTNDTFCTIPWTTVVIGPSGDLGMCCFSLTGQVGIDDDGKPMNILTHSLTDMLNSRINKEVRKYQSENRYHPACEQCWRRDRSAKTEQTPSNSMRKVRSFEQFPNWDVDKRGVLLQNAKDFLREDYTVNTNLVSLDLRFSNLCNQKCIMCTPQFSTLWYEDWEKIRGASNFSIGIKSYQIKKEGHKYVTDMVPWHDSPIWWDQFEKIKHQVFHYYLTGGEPFIMPAHGQLLDNLIESDLAKNVILEYDTNLSVINTQILNRFSKFKKVLIRVSCDDTEDRYHIIRFPGKFNKLVENLEKLKTVPNVEIQAITTCIGIYSIFAPIRLHRYFSPIGYTINTRPLIGPNEFDIIHLTNKMKQRVIDIYKTADVPFNVSTNVVGMLRQTLSNYRDEESKEWIEKFVRRMNKFDEIRKTDWKSTFPEVVALLNV